MCIISASTGTGYHTAKPKSGRSSIVATTRRQSSATADNPKDAIGSDVTEPALTPKPTEKPTSKRPDFRQQYTTKPEYYCLKRFMGAFNQQDCYCFMTDPDNDKCLFQSFQGECERGE